MKKQSLNTLALGSAMAIGACMTACASTDNANPFQANEMNNGYETAAKKADAKCGEGKCGGKKADAKCGEGKCGSAKTTTAKKADAKCGEGKCGSAKTPTTKKADAKCGEGKCGGHK